MNILLTVIIVVQVVSALSIIALVLLQHGKGADMGAAFGSGASGSLFGASGSSNFLSKTTGVAATVFFCATLALAYFGTQSGATGGGGVMENLPASAVPGQQSSAPAADQPAAEGSAAKPAAPVSGAGSEQSNQIPK